MGTALLAHQLAAAHTERVPELARLYGALARAVSTGGVESEPARQAHRALSDRVGRWIVADREAERRDIVALTSAEREAMIEEVDRAIPHAELIAPGLPPEDEVHDVILALRRMRTAFPTALPRAAVVRFRRSATRLKRMEALGAPVIILGNEPGILLRAVESGIEPIVAPELPYSPARSFQGTLIRAVEACVIHQPGAAQGVNLGLGASPAVAALLGVADEDFGELHERWVEAAAPSHPFARSPFVPRGRFCAADAGAAVRADFEDTGPIGWAAGHDVADLARDLAARADEHPAFAPEIWAAAARIEAAAAGGQAVIGLVEYLSPEADGEPSWFADPGDDA
jgi:hypothetical protein